MSEGIHDALSRARFDRGLQPVAVATALEEARPFPSFAEYMELVLHDPETGYYGSGSVRFGLLEDYWTFPHALGPAFAAMVAEAARSLLEEMTAAGALPDDAPLTLLELGGGDGTSGEALCDYIESRATDERWRPFARRLEVVLGEASPALRETQSARLARHIASGRAECRSMDARRLQWEGPFHGVVHGNELITAFPCERLRFHDRDAPARRVHVVPLVVDPDSTAGTHPAPEGLRGILGASRALDLDALARVLRREGGGAAALRRAGVVLAELEVPTDLGWVGETPPGLPSCLERCAPLVADLGACGLLPTELTFVPALADFGRALGALLHAPDRVGAALFVDYGGTTRHCLDPRSPSSHLRVYGPERSLMHRCRPYDDPGRTDITYDLDFNDLAHHAAEAGLRVAFYGQQRALEAPPVELDAEELPEGLPAVVERFRRGAGFQLVVLAAADSGVSGARFGASDPLDGIGLATVCRAPAAGLPPEVTAALRPGADVVAALADVGLYERRHEILALLMERGLLGAPGTLAASPPVLRRASALRMRWRGDRVELTRPGSTGRVVVDLDYVELLAQLAEPCTAADLEARLRPTVGDDGWRRIETMLAQLVQSGMVLAASVDDAEAAVVDAPGLESWQRLLADRVCVEAFERALRQCVREGDTVIDLGTGTGLLAMLAARAGAKQVLAADRPSMRAVVESLVARNRLAGRVRFLPLPLSRPELPRKADLLVTGDIGAFGHPATLLAAPELVASVLAESGRLVPRAREIFVAPIADPKRFAERVGSLAAPVAGLDYSALYGAALCRADSSRPIAPDRLLAAPLGLGREDFGRIGDGLERQLVFDLERDGPIDGLGFSFVLDLCDGVSIDTGFDRPATHWNQTWLPLPRFAAVAGERFGLRVRLGVEEDGALVLELHCGIVRGDRLEPDHRVRLVV